MRPRLAAAVLAALLAGSACSAQVHVGSQEPRISAPNLEKKISDALEAKFGKRPDDMNCPAGLDGKVGATTRCILTAGSDRLGVTVKADRVDGDNIHFTFEVDKKPMQ
jgi:hypothetical protein